MRRLRARLAPGQRVLLVIVLGAALGLSGRYLAASATLGAWVPLWGSSGVIALGSGASPAWAVQAIILLVVVAVWLGLSVPLLASPAGAAAPSPGGRLARLGDGQRAVLTIGLGAALAVLGSSANQLATGTAATTGVLTYSGAYAPLTRSFYLAPLPGSLPGWAHALIWLGVIAIWATASWRLLGRRPASPPPAARASATETASEPG